MNRRTFLQRNAIARKSSIRRTHNPNGLSHEGINGTANGFPGIHGKISMAGLEPYVPSGAQPWNEARAAHLLRRTGFGVTKQKLDAALTATPQQLVQAMLAEPPLPDPPGEWVNLKNDITNGSTEADQQGWMRDMQEWWFDLMMQPAGALREKMTLFWHNHFVSEFQIVYFSQYLYFQNQLFRRMAFGNFKELTNQITIDRAMLKYLDLGSSRAGNPNENYPRELLELFTLGEGRYSDGTPHYTEHDIVELSRALTGWVINEETGSGEFRSARFDSGNKTIFGETANFSIKGVGDRDVIDLIFNQTDQDFNHNRTAIFICSKLYRNFVYDIPDMDIVVQMADTLLQNDWSIGAVLSQLLTSAHFFDENVFGAMIKSPAEYVVGSMQEFNLDLVMARQNRNVGRPETHDPVTAMEHLFQSPFNPPNVKGWPGGRTWISSVTVPLRIRYSEMWIAPVNGALPYNFDPVAYIKSFPGYDDVEVVLGHFISLLLPLGVAESTRERLLDELLGGAPVYEWNPDHPATAQRIRSCLVSITNLAEYQLM